MKMHYYVCCCTEVFAKRIMHVSKNMYGIPLKPTVSMYGLHQIAIWHRMFTRVRDDWKPGIGASTLSGSLTYALTVQVQLLRYLTIVTKTTQEYICSDILCMHLLPATVSNMFLLHLVQKEFS